MGSAARRTKRRERLLAAGVTEEELDRASPRRSASTSARSRPRRPRCRSWPRSWPCATAARAAGCRSAAGASTRSALDRRRSCSPPAGRALRRARSSSPSSTAGRCSSTRSTRCSRRRVERVVVVLGAEAEQVPRGVDLGTAPGCRLRATGTRARRPRCAAASQAVGDCDAAVITLGDQPRVTPAGDRAGVIDAARADGADAVRATYDGAPGHPVAARRATLLDRMRDAARRRTARATCSLSVHRCDVRGERPRRPERRRHPRPAGGPAHA